jgi:hypothetical protein
MGDQEDILMPSSPGYKRNYKQEYKNYQGSEEQKQKRASRNKVRRQAMRDGRVKLGDGMDIDHKNGNPKDNSKSNTRVVRKSTNRSFPRNRNAGKR